VHTLAYFNYTNDHDKNLVSLYTYCKHTHPLPETIYIVSSSNNIPPERLFEYNKITRVKFITPDQLKVLMQVAENNINLTGTVSTNNETFTKDVQVTDPVKLAKNRIAVVVYVYYPGYFTEIFNSIKTLAPENNIDIHVYLCTERAISDATKIFKLCEQNSYINLRFNWCVNKGRDVRSFLQFIYDKHYVNYDYICKIHTKQTTYLDPEWRQNYIYGLLAPINAHKHWKQLDKRPGKCTSVDRYMIHEKGNGSNYNYRGMESLCRLYSIPVDKLKRFSFYAGTMFWVDKSYCNKLYQMLTENVLNNFESEPIQNDGTMAHAWERFFSII